MTLTSGMTTYKTFAFVEVREEVSEAESRNVFDIVKRAFQVNVTDEITTPERFIVSQKNAILLDKLSDVDLFKLPPVCKESAQNILRQDYEAYPETCSNEICKVEAR